MARKKKGASGKDLHNGDGLKRDLWVPGKVPSLPIPTAHDR